jgi:hypothetical protein
MSWGDCGPAPLAFDRGSQRDSRGPRCFWTWGMGHVSPVLREANKQITSQWPVATKYQVVCYLLRDFRALLRLRLSSFPQQDPPIPSACLAVVSSEK